MTTCLLRSVINLLTLNYSSPTKVLGSNIQSMPNVLLSLLSSYILLSWNGEFRIFEREAHPFYVGLLNVAWV